MDKYKIDLLYKNSLIQDIDIRFSDLLLKLAGENASEELYLASIFLNSTIVKSMHISFDLGACAEKSLGHIFSDIDISLAEQLEDVITPSMGMWREKLLKSGVVGFPAEYKPLILDEKNRLYLYRYFEYETNLAQSIKDRVKREKHNIDFDLLKKGISRCFSDKSHAIPDWQKIAAVAAVVNNFSVISGGPGTGKTYTVTNILALYLEQKRNLNIALCAPTGKAAARLSESIKKAKLNINFKESIVSRIPETASTIHRLLGVRPGSPYFRHNINNKLSADLVIVDEASMVSMPLMTKLIQAVSSNASIILLGDRNQLASVEAGAVLGDICRTSDIDSFSTSFCEKYFKITGEHIPVRDDRISNAVSDAVVELKQSFRFDSESGIAMVSCAVNKGDSVKALELLKQHSDASIKFFDLPHAGKLTKMVHRVFKEKIEPVFLCKSIDQAFTFLENFRILCSHKKGPTGVSRINMIVESMLQEKGFFEKSKKFYKGRPIIILSNDYNLNLYNGDVGIIWEDENREIRAFFPDDKKGFRTFSPARLPVHETLFAMTIHKSQGSEYDSILMILPDKESPILTRELIYTGITRAKTSAVIWMNQDVFKKGVKMRVKRASGLADRLHGDETTDP
ncbi:MAG: exodeoxyribonuclease V subunit alpha [Thermodesulfobacteriota bacterium]|nr:exodeoxyribonuclease V subunit alpha [Thermodesulfobacteriota bacterium]